MTQTSASARTSARRALSPDSGETFTARTLTLSPPAPECVRADALRILGAGHSSWPIPLLEERNMEISRFESVAEHRLGEAIRNAVEELPLRARARRLADATFTLAYVVSAPDTTAPKFLAEALEELEELDEYAAESGLPPPSPTAVKFARRILESVVRAVPLYYSVSPVEGGKVAIQAGDKRKNAVLLLCDADGGASYHVSVDGENRHEHYDSARRLPDPFVLEALRKLERGDE